MKVIGRDSTKYIRYAWIGWACVAVVIAALCAVNIWRGKEHTVTGAYRGAAAKWQASENIYSEDIHGFLYLPHGAIIFSPFAMLPYAAGEIAWRVVGIGLFALGVWRLAQVAGKASGTELFPLMTLLIMPLLLESAQNGQMNLLLGAMMMLAAAALARGGYGRATIWLMIGLAIKPLMLVMILLACAVYPRLLWRAAVGLVILFLSPLLIQRPEYVWQQYLLFLKKLSVASDPVGQGTAREAFLYSDIFGMLRAWGVDVATNLQTIVRGLAALATLWLSWLGRKRMGQVNGAVLLFALATCYLMLFNPRTENNSYALVGPALAVFATWAFLVDKKLVVGGLLVTAIMLMAGSYEITKHITPGKAIWLSPLLCSIFLGYVAYVIVAQRKSVCAKGV